MEEKCCKQKKIRFSTKICFHVNHRSKTVFSIQKNGLSLNLIKLVETSPHWIKQVKIGSNLSNYAQSCQIWFRLVKIGSILSNLLQSYWKWFKVVEFWSNLSKLVQTCQDWIRYLKIDSNLSKLLKLVKFGPNLCQLSHLHQTCLNLSKS